MYKIPESVLVVIHTLDLQVLMIARADNADFWQSVTGSKDFSDEPLIQTAMREVAEETGIIVASGDVCEAGQVPLSHLRDWRLSNVYEIYPTWRHRYAPGVTKNTEHVFSLQVPADIGVTLAPREHVDFRWLPHRAAADLCFSPSNAEAILQLPHYLRDVIR
ncbi:dihydroneopterin triphosphate diphosphatase [Glaciimonas sp. GG7]